ncbi:MAG: YceI family protein [Pseudomonadota bacterium]
MARGHDFTQSMAATPSRRMVLAGIVATALPGARAAAAAPEWRVVPAASRIGFSYSLNGKAAEGHFEEVAGSGQMDLSDPQAASLDMRIRSDSIDLGNPLFSAFATSAEWFDARNHPEVVYRLRGLNPLGGQLYRAEGDIEIRGKRAVTVSEIALDIQGNEARAQGRLALDRTEFLLGVGPSALVVDVGREVAVEFDLIAQRA